MTAKNKSDELPDSPVGALLKLYKSRIKDLAPQQVSDLFIESLEAAIELEKQELGEILIIDPDVDVSMVIKCIRLKNYLCLTKLNLFQVTLNTDAVKGITGLFDTQKYGIRALSIVDSNFPSNDLQQSLFYSIRNIPIENLQIRHQTGLLSESTIFWKCFSVCSHLTDLTLAYCELTHLSCVCLATTLKKFPSLANLDLEGNPIETTGAFVLLEEPVKMKRWGFRNCQIDRLPVKCKSMRSRLFDEMMVAMKNHITSNSALEEIDVRDNLLHQTDYEHMLQALKDRPYSKCAIKPCEQQVSPELFRALLGQGGKKKGKGGKKGKKKK